MADAQDFRELIRRVRQGDAQASVELVRRYEPAVRLAVHVRLTDPRLRRVLDSVDICQSVLASFFLRAAAGQYDLETPEQLLKLLAAMARNKLLRQVEKHQAARRDHRLVRTLSDGAEPVDPGPDPGDVLAQRDLLHELRRRLPEAERRLADRRAEGRSWREIAAEWREQPNTLRMRLERAVDRVARELGVD
jgi:RNA polymerase sigma-70 factor (ECF subfamily)